MGIFKDMLYTGVRKREAEEEYERTHPRTYRDDYSSSSSRPRKVRYRAYCKKCGAYTTHTSSSASEAVKYLQYEIGTSNTIGGCGKKNHLAEIEKVEE